MTRSEASEYGGVFRAMGAKVVTMPVAALAMFALTSLTIAAVGGAGYGTLSVISGLYLMFPFADLGLGAAVINAVASGAGERAQTVVRQAFRTLWWPALALCVAGVAGVYLFSWSSLLQLSGFSDARLDAIVALSLILFGVSIPLGVGQRILVGAGRNHWAVYVSLLSGLTSLGVAVMLVVFDAPGEMFALPVAIGLVVTNLVSMVIGLRVLGMSGVTLVTGRQGIRRRELLSSGAPMMVIMVGLPLMFSTHRVILSLQGTPSETAEYSLAMQIYNPFWSVVSIAGASLWPIFARRRALVIAASSSDNGEPRRLLRPLGIFAGFGAIAAVLIIVSGQFVASLVSHGEIGLSLLLLGAAGTLIFVQSVQQVPGMFLTDVSGLWAQAAFVAIGAPLSVVAIWVLVPILGPVAPIAVTAVVVFAVQFIPSMVVSLRRSRRGQ